MLHIRFEHSCNGNKGKWIRKGHFDFIVLLVSVDLVMFTF